MNDNKSPCFNCPDRTQSCHGVCEKYKEYRKEKDIVMKKRNEHYQEQDFIAVVKEKMIKKYIRDARTERHGRGKG